MAAILNVAQGSSDAIMGEDHLSSIIYPSLNLTGPMVHIEDQNDGRCMSNDLQSSFETLVLFSKRAYNKHHY